MADVKIIKLSTFDDYAIVYFSPAYTFSDEQVCDKNSTGLSSKMVVRFENDDNKEMYATIMAAAVSNKTAGFGVVGCDIPTGYPKMYRVDVHF